MTEEIKRIIKSLQGNIVAFGFKSDKFKSILNSNSKILCFDILDEVSKNNKKGKCKSKNIYIKDLKKKYKKDKVDFILINVDVMDHYMIYLIKETIYIGKNTLYLFGNKDKVNYYLNKYRRYKISYDLKEYNNNMIAYIDITKAKNKKIRDRLYIFSDKIESFVNLLIDVLTS